MMRVLTIAGLVLALAGTAHGQPADKLPIAPLLDEQTVAVAHVRLDKLDVSRLVALAAKAADLKPGDAAMMEAAGKLALLALTGAGAKDVYAVASLDGFPFETGFIAIPVANEADGKQIAGAIKLTLNLPDTPEKTAWGQMMIQRTGSFVLIAQKNTAKRLQTMQPVPRPKLAAALAAFPKADIRIAVAFPNSLRRSLGELIPELPREMGGGKTAPLLNGFQYFALGATLTQTFSAEAVLPADAESVAGIRALLIELLKLTKKEFVQEFVDPKLLPHAEKAIALLTPKAGKDRLTWKVSEAELVEAVHPLVSQLSARQVQSQSVNNLKQIGLCMHNYYDANKHFPTGIRDKQGKLLLSWRVQILPYLDEAPLYEKFKLDEAWDSPHNLPLAKQMPAALRSPNSKSAPDKTVYLGPLGKGLFFDRAAPERKFQDIQDGTSNTIMILAVDDAQAETWTKPADLNIDPKDALRGLGGIPPGRFQALFGDGSVRVLDRKIGPMEFFKMLTIAGGEVLRELP